MEVPFSIHTLSRICFKLLFVAVFFVGAVHSVHAAQVIVSPSSGTYSNGQSFTTTIRVNPEGDSVNAVEAQLSFDNTKLSVVSVSKTGSVFSLWTTEPTFSNSDGTIDFGGGSPTPFTSTSDVLTVTFRALEEGSANVGVASASTLAADGQGTDVYSGSTDATYTIGAADTPSSEPTTQEPQETTDEDESDDDAAITFGDPPRAPEVGSQTFLDPEAWYSETEAVFVWELPFDVDAVALDIATSSEAEPETVYDPPIEEFSTNDEVLSQGIQYLTVQFHNQVGWGSILHRKIKIDSEPPEDFKINVNPGSSQSSFPLLTFDAKDETSGIDYYEMTIADGEPIQITPEEAELGYLLGELKDGTYTVRVTAYDKAGNSTESSTPVLITAGWTPPVETVVETTFWDLFKGKNLVIILLILLILFLAGYIYSTKKRAKEREEKLRRETKEIQDQMEKIFSALRDEIYEQINQITKRTRLSKKEKETVENLNQALEVSETLIEKEVGDVKEILK